MSLSQRIQFTPVDNARLQNLCGPLDENLKQIETALDVSIARRGEGFKVVGARAADAVTALEMFYLRAERQPLEVEDIQLGLVEFQRTPPEAVDEGVIAKDPIVDQVAAVSCGVYNNTPVLDLEYEEDSNAEADANFVLTGKGDIVEIQATGEKRGFTQAEFEALFSLARKGIGELCEAQRAATSK